MSSTANPVFPPLAELFGRLNFLYGLLRLLSNQLQNFERTLRKKFEGEAGLPKWLLLGSSIPFTDLTGETDEGWLKYRPSGGFLVSGEQYIEAAKIIVRRNSAWTVSQGYEAFETFLLDAAAAFLFANQGEADRKKLHKFVTLARRDGLVPSHRRFWQSFVRRFYRGKDNAKILGLLRSIASDLADAERDNNRGLDLRRWYRAASIVRHAVTHSDRAIEDPSGLSEESTWFPCECRDGKRVLALDPKNAEQSLRTFAEYGFLVFKYLSQVQGYEWDILEKGFKPTGVTGHV